MNLLPHVTSASQVSASCLMQGQEVPLPTMSMEAADLLNKLGMSFSTSGELWVRLVRHWRQFLLHHHFQAEAGGTDQALLEAAVSKVSHLLWFGTSSVAKL